MTKKKLKKRIEWPNEWYEERPEVKDRADLLAGKPKRREPPKPKPKEKPPVPPKTLVGSAAREDRDVLSEITKFFKGAGEFLVYVGIDTGKDGAIGLLCPRRPNLTTAFSLPMVSALRSGKTKKGNLRYKSLYDEPTIWRWFQVIKEHSHQVLVCIEETQPRETDGGRTGHALGYGLGMWPLFLISHNIPFETILPHVWKQKMGLAGKDKEWSRLMAQRLWPSAPLFRKKDEARAEALLIAECVRRRRMA